MRYNPATDRAVSIDAIAEQCRKAIMPAVPAQPKFGQLATNTWHRWRDHGAGSNISGSRTLGEELQGWHAANVAEAMGDRAKARLIRRQIMLSP